MRIKTCLDILKMLLALCKLLGLSWSGKQLGLCCFSDLSFFFFFKLWSLVWSYKLCLSLNFPVVILRLCLFTTKLGYSTNLVSRFSLAGQDPTRSYLWKSAYQCFRSLKESNFSVSGTAVNSANPNPDVKGRVRRGKKKYLVVWFGDQINHL